MDTVVNTCCNHGIKEEYKDGICFMSYCNCAAGKARRYALPEKMIEWNIKSYPGPQEAIHVAWEWLKTQTGKGVKERNAVYWQWDTPSAGWLLLEGNFGSGKTGLAVACYKVILDRMIDAVGVVRFMTSSPRMAQFWSVSELCKAQKETYGKDMIRPVSNAEKALFLVLDDVGAERYTEDNVDIIAQLIQHRYANNKHTLLTTNLSGAEFRDAFGMRVADRLRDNATIISFSGKSLRQAPNVHKV